MPCCRTSSRSFRLSKAGVLPNPNWYALFIIFSPQKTTCRPYTACMLSITTLLLYLLIHTQLMRIFHCWTFYLLLPYLSLSLPCNDIFMHSFYVSWSRNHGNRQPFQLLQIPLSNYYSWLDSTFFFPTSSLEAEPLQRLYRSNNCDLQSHQPLPLLSIFKLLWVRNSFQTPLLRGHFSLWKKLSAMFYN